MRWLADVDNEGLPREVEYVPEESAVTNVQMHHDDVRRRTTVSCLQPVKGTEGEFVPRMTVIPWS